VLHFQSYPFLDAATTTTASRNTVFHLNPQELSCYLPTDGAAPGFVVPTSAQILAAAYQEEDIPAGGKVTRRIDLAAGKPTFMQEDANGDGSLEHRVWYEAGVPVRGERDLSAPGDSRVAEIYANGTLSMIRVDSDGDGKIDYAEQYAAGTVKLWDYNEDGTWDARELPGANATVIREFSTALNGVFDLRVTFKAGKIVGAQAKGHTLSVTPGADRATLWIGAVVPSVRVSADTPDGVMTAGGRNFLVFRFSGVTYIEAIQ